MRTSSSLKAKILYGCFSNSKQKETSIPALPVNSEDENITEMEESSVKY